MSRFWKRTGWFGLAIAALGASMALQLVLGVIAMLPAAIAAGMQAGIQGITDPMQIQEMVMEKAFGAASIGVLLYHVLSLPIFGLWYYFGCGRPKAGNPVRILKARGIIATLVAGFGLCLVANGIAMMIQYLAPAVFAEYMELMEAAGMGEDPMTILAAVILAPIGEEILCRGIVLYYGMKMAQGIGSEKVSFWIANVLQALLFGIMHGNIVQGTYAFVLGMGLGLLYRRYHSLYPAMLCHFAINFLSTFVMGYLFWWVPENLFGTVIIFVLGAGFTLLAVALAGKRRQERDLESGAFEQ